MCVCFLHSNVETIVAKVNANVAQANIDSKVKGIKTIAFVTVVLVKLVRMLLMLLS